MVRIARLECKHTRACDMTPRQTLRCRKCRTGAKGSAVVKTAAKQMKKAA